MTRSFTGIARRPGFTGQSKRIIAGHFIQDPVSTGRMCGHGRTCRLPEEIRIPGGREAKGLRCVVSSQKDGALPVPIEAVAWRIWGGITLKTGDRKSVKGGTKTPGPNPVCRKKDFGKTSGTKEMGSGLRTGEKDPRLCGQGVGEMITEAQRSSTYPAIETGDLKPGHKGSGKNSAGLV